MRLERMLAVAGCIAFVAATSIAGAATKSGVVDAAYDGYPVTPPTPEIIFVCHGFGCKYRVELDLTAADRAKLTQLMAAGKSSAAAERKALPLQVHGSTGASVRWRAQSIMWRGPE
jgi:hypothetical protein